MTLLRGIFLTSSYPERTAHFYEQVAQLPLERVDQGGGYVYWKLDRDGMQLAIHASAPFAEYAHPPLSGSNLTHIYFKIESQEAFLSLLKRAGLAPVAVDEVVITVEDPDGRMVLFGLA